MLESCLYRDKKKKVFCQRKYSWILFYFSCFCFIYFLAPVCIAGKYAADFLSIGAGAKSLALGGAAIASSDDAFGAYWNPATLVRVKSYSLAMMHAEMFSGLQAYNYVGFSSKIKNLGSLGISWIRLSVDDIPIFSGLEGTAEERRANLVLQPSSKPEGFLQDAEDAGLLSYAYSAPEPLKLFSIPVEVSFGGNIKYVRQNAGLASASGTGLDLAALISTLPQESSFKKQFSIGIVAQDAGTTRISWDTEKRDVMPMNFLIGFAYNLAISEGKKEKYSFTFTFDLSTRYGIASHAGTEFVLANLLALRCGISRRKPAVGVGFLVRKFSLDYAFSMSNLANSHFLSLQYGAR